MIPCMTKNGFKVQDSVEGIFLQGNTKPWKLQMTDGGKGIPVSLRLSSAATEVVLKSAEISWLEKGKGAPENA